MKLLELVSCPERCIELAEEIYLEKKNLRDRKNEIFFPFVFIRKKIMRRPKYKNIGKMK